MSAAINTVYDDTMYRPRSREYYRQSDFFNFGYWLAETRNQEEACENLMEKLLGFIPEKRGIILDVACGMGATTRYLLKYYGPSDVTGINISAKQLETSRLNAPGCRFILMDAARLAFRDGLFDNVICVESAFHFDTRERFLQEAYRVLKLGGYLVLSDILWRRNRYMPEENFVKGLKEYRDVYLRSGFQEVEVVDVTNECWKGFRKHLTRWGWKKLLAKERGVGTFCGGLLFWGLGFSVLTRHYLLVSAKKV